MTFPLTTNLPPALNTYNDDDTLKEAVIQLSQLVAWTWYDDYFYAKKENKNEELIGKEKQLKKFVIEIFNLQSMYSVAFLSYGNETAKTAAARYSRCIEFLFKSEHENIDKTDIAPLEMEIPTLTLNQLFLGFNEKRNKKNNNQKGFILSSKKGKELVNLCVPIVETNTFMGQFSEIKGSSKDEQKKFIARIAFPPSYPLDNTKKDILWKWVTEVNETYLPPLLLPLGACS
ncbi:MAG: hypothetical protein F6K48_09820 [Okeania sp. SIO3H1]|nr:hypothetical protein [Okeania sp. SIO3H1]